MIFAVLSLGCMMCLMAGVEYADILHERVKIYRHRRRIRRMRDRYYALYDSAVDEVSRAYFYAVFRCCDEELRESETLEVEV